MIQLPAISQVKEEVNPFFTEYKTPFQVPPFSLIKNEHYLPAFEKGIAEQQAEIDVITNNTADPTFENTIAAFDKSGKQLRKVGSVFYSLNSANTNPEMQALNRQIAPLTTKHRDNISLNDKLFQRIKVVYQSLGTSKLSADQKRVVDKYYKDFVRSGANLNENDKTKLRDLNQKLSVASIKFNEDLLAETNTNFKLVIDNKDDLDGLPAASITAAAEDAKKAGLEGKWIFTLQKPSMLPFLQYAKNRALREKLYRGYFMRGNNNDAFDNKELVLTIMNLRSEKAILLGFKTHAEYVISNNMAQTPENVYTFLDDLMKPAQEVAKRDRDEMQKIIDREGGTFKLEPWDWWYYTEIVRKEKYNLEESELKPYFALENVRNGMFAVANKLYGIKFTKMTDCPVYLPEVEAYDVRDEKGSHIGVLYLDYHPRPGKRVGAWCGRFRSQSYDNGKKITPVVTIVCNFTPPSGTTPSLLSWDEVSTLFHEFGHGLHGLFTDGKYERTAGSLQRDMVELPSQIMENWAAEPEVLRIYAKHYQTGVVMPDELMNRLSNSMKFNEAFNTVEYIAASMLDLDWHSFTAPQKVDVIDFEKASMSKIGLMDEILPRYRSTYFSHIIGGYDAGYYVYLWAAVLDADAFQYFVDSKDIYNKQIAAKFRKYILTEGGSDEGMVQYLKFRGQEPSREPLLNKRGLN
jgi:peptidyl-dipeptidase Dcp